jgi:hypothetical protein
MKETTVGARWIAGAAMAAAAATLIVAAPAVADDPAIPTPGMEVDDDNGRCTAGFAADDADGNQLARTFPRRMGIPAVHTRFATC